MWHLKDHLYWNFQVRVAKFDLSFQVVSPLSIGTGFVSPLFFSAYVTQYSTGLSPTILICVVADCCPPTVFTNFIGHY